ncbi:hypothetical protein BVY03_00250, partial [bacterium K02(2017)]
DSSQLMISYHSDFKYINDINAAFYHKYSNDLVTPDKILLNVQDFRSFSQDKNQINYLLKMTGIKKHDDTITISKGTYHINQDIIFPPDLNLNIDAGTKLLLGKDVSFLVRGNLNINGTKENKVFITAKDKGNHFGSFAIIGKNNTCNVSHLDLSEGSEDVIDGIYFSGAFVMDQCDLNMQHTAVHHNHAEDGLHVLNSKINIANSQFYNNFADQVDLDSNQGIIVNSTFGPTGSQNGDGLDLSLGKIHIKDSLFNNCLDKGLSVGEKSRVYISNSKMIENNMAMAVKDGSIAILNNNFFNQNNNGIHLYIKKEIYDSPKAYWLGDLPSQSLFKTQNKSEFKAFSVNSLEYKDFQNNLNKHSDVAKLLDDLSWIR